MAGADCETSWAKRVAFCRSASAPAGSVLFSWRAFEYRESAAFIFTTRPVTFPPLLWASFTAR